MRDIVLASSSPRRLQLLKMLGIPNIIIIPPHVDEQSVENIPPEGLVCRLALSKAENVASSAEYAELVSGTGSSLSELSLPLIIAADTVVYLDGQVLGKPVDTTDAVRMLRTLSGQKHTVYTGVVLLSVENSIVFSEKTDVYFREISEFEIKSYVASDEPMDKAGAYAAQGGAAAFIERIDGDFYNVVGLPLCKLSQELQKFTV